MVPAVRLRVFARLAGFAVLLGAIVLPATASAAQRSAGRALRQGMRGEAVRALQSELTQAGFIVRRTGVYDSATVRAVRSFERRYHLAVDGIAGARFMRALNTIRAYDLAAVDRPLSGGAAIADSSGGGGLTGPTTTTGSATGTRTGTTTGTPTQIGTERHSPNLPNRRYGSRTLRRGMTGTDVENLQNYLTLAGYPTSVDGAFGPLTRRSVVRFQRASHLRATGVVPRGEQKTLQRDVNKAVTTSASAGQATLNADGTATAPADAPAAVQNAIAAANSIIDTPYIYGGGHGSFTDNGYDCSGSVSFALHGGGLLSSPEDSTQLESYGQPGPGQWITVYANSSHAFVVIAGLAFDTAHYGPTFPSGTGPRWLQPADVTANLSDGTGGYVVRHPAGL
ncbi:MAG TPA: peptidoglycan-binding domain-containing protein [Solirubrobacteraceae bacterium]|nr:peptidoglycan-binding domain-containing protein [Solirubrobacteraceae bacterium]